MLFNKELHRIHTNTPSTMFDSYITGVRRREQEVW
jgi:hypothetical protein